MSDPDQNIRDDSLAYHRRAPAGKIALSPTKQLTNQRDLALAYTPGVAAACDEIVRDPRDIALSAANHFQFDRFPAIARLFGLLPNGEKLYRHTLYHLLAPESYRINRMTEAVLHGDATVLPRSIATFEAFET